MSYIKNASTMGFSIDGDYIYEVFIDKDKEVVGVTKEYYNACNDEREQYYNRLVELGDIIPEKTAETLAKEQSDTLNKILCMLEKQDQRLAKLEQPKAVDSEHFE